MMKISPSSSPSKELISPKSALILFPSCVQVPVCSFPSSIKVTVLSSLNIKIKPSLSSRSKVATSSFCWNANTVHSPAKLFPEGSLPPFPLKKKNASKAIIIAPAPIMANLGIPPPDFLPPSSPLEWDCWL